MDPQVIRKCCEGLEEKRSQVSEWLRETPPQKRRVCLGSTSESGVQSHLSVIEMALEKAASGTLGTCTVCRETVETGLLEMDYTSDVCLSHLSSEERRNLELELELAQTVQRSFLPQRVPELPFLEIAALSRPAQIIGGDYFDFLRFADGSQGLVIADVAGHGVSAGLHMASAQALLRSLVPTSDSPADVLERLNRLWIHNVRFTTFVALFLASFDPATHRLSYSNAGHSPPVVVRGGDAGEDGASWLLPTGAAVGLVEEGSYTPEALQLHPGDILVMYTDGVSEARNADGEEFGRERLAATMRHNLDGSARDLVQAARQELEAFSQGQALADDMTIVICRITG